MFLSGVVIHVGVASSASRDQLCRFLFVSSTSFVVVSLCGVREGSRKGKLRLAEMNSCGRTLVVEWPKQPTLANPERVRRVRAGIRASGSCFSLNNINTARGPGKSHAAWCLGCMGLSEIEESGNRLDRRSRAWMGLSCSSWNCMVGWEHLEAALGGDRKSVV